MRLNYIDKITSENPCNKNVQVIKKGYNCAYCNCKSTHYLVVSNKQIIVLNSENNTLFNIDHIIPRSKGGSDFLDNLVLSCVECNNQKGDKIIKVKNKPKMRLFYMLKTYYGKNSRIRAGSLVCATNTDINRVTVFYNKKRFVVPIEYLGGTNIKDRLK